MAEDHQTMEDELVDDGLNAVIFDVWDSILLPMLSIPDIFHLCCVSRYIRRLLFNEPTFKRLCLVRTVAQSCVYECLLFSETLCGQ